VVAVVRIVVMIVVGAPLARQAKLVATQFAGVFSVPPVRCRWAEAATGR